MDARTALVQTKRPLKSRDLVPSPTTGYALDQLVAAAVPTIHEATSRVGATIVVGVQPKHGARLSIPIRCRRSATRTS